MNHKSLNQLGRSLIEMLAVISIISIITMGGIKAFTAAMNLFYPISTQSEIEEVAQGVIELYSWKKDYSGVGQGSFLCDNNILRSCDSGNGWKNVWGGTMLVSENGLDSFKITLTNVPKISCRKLIEMQWAYVVPQTKTCQNGPQEMVFESGVQGYEPCEGDGCGGGGENPPDLCAQKTCNAPNGFCVAATGLCQCKTGYTGANCETRDKCSADAGYVKPTCPTNTSGSCYSLTGSNDSCGNPTCRTGVFSNVTHQDLNGEGCCVSKIEKSCSLSPISPRTCTPTCKGGCEGDACNLDKCTGNTPIEDEFGDCYACSESSDIQMSNDFIAQTGCVDVCAGGANPRKAGGRYCAPANKCTGNANSGTPIMDNEAQCYACDFFSTIWMNNKAAAQTECVNVCEGQRYNNNALCNKCTIGTYNPTGTTSCTTCPTNFETLTKESYCKACGGTWNGSKCLGCPPFSPIEDNSGRCYACDSGSFIEMGDEISAQTKCVDVCAGGSNPRVARGSRCVPANKCTGNASIGTPIIDEYALCYACSESFGIPMGDPTSAQTGCMNICAGGPNPRVRMGGFCLLANKCKGTATTGEPVIDNHGDCYACDSTTDIAMGDTTSAQTECVNVCEGQRYNNYGLCNKCTIGTYNPTTGMKPCTTCPTNFATLTKAGYCKACGGTWNGSSCSGSCPNGSTPGTGANVGKCCLNGVCCASGQTPYCLVYNSNGTCNRASCGAAECKPVKFDLINACCTSDQTPYCSSFYNGKCESVNCYPGKCTTQPFTVTFESACCPSNQTPYCFQYNPDKSCAIARCGALGCTQQPFDVSGYGACCTSNQTAYCKTFSPNGVCYGAACR